MYFSIFNFAVTTSWKLALYPYKVVLSINPQEFPRNPVCSSKMKMQEIFELAQSFSETT